MRLFSLSPIIIIIGILYLLSTNSTADFTFQDNTLMHSIRCYVEGDAINDMEDGNTTIENITSCYEIRGDQLNYNSFDFMINNMYYVIAVIFILSFIAIFWMRRK